MAKVTKADMVSAQEEVKKWEELCSNFNFRIALPAKARDMLVKMFAHLGAMKMTDSLVRRMQCYEPAAQLVAVWLLWCDESGCVPELHKSAREMLAGVLIDPVTRAGAQAGRTPYFRGMIRGELAMYGFTPPPIESMN